MLRLFHSEVTGRTAYQQKGRVGKKYDKIAMKPQKANNLKLWETEKRYN